ncbi:MAG: VWA domain-containing protein, partial [Acidobacteria bacterium]|nr:VWA domain-containing protein [Acidobacteriota bacterium]
PDLELAAGTRMEIELVRELALSRTAVQRARALPVRTPQPADLYADSQPDESEELEEPAEETGTESVEEAKEETEIAHNRTPLPPPAPPADPAEDPTLGDPGAYRMRVNVQLVLVEAHVREPHGTTTSTRLAQLTKEDFRLFEDGVEQTIRHFSRDELPLAVALVVDTSGSVAPYIRELRRAALEALSQLKRGDQVALFAFTDQVDLLVPLTTDRQRVARRIERLRGEGGTNILEALWEATNYLLGAAPERRRAIILVSDNRATVRPRVNQSQVIRNALEADTVIYSIKTPGEETPLTLRLPTWLGGFGSVDKITRETGGEILDVDRLGSVSAALRAVVERLKTRYTLGYHPTNKARDGSFRQIEVSLADRFGQPEGDYVVLAKRGYYAPRDSLPADSRAANSGTP